jgi:hypothetical protein
VLLSVHLQADGNCIFRSRRSHRYRIGARLLDKGWTS